MLVILPDMWWACGLGRIYQSKVCQFKLVPDQRSEIMFDVIIRCSRIKSIIFVWFDDRIVKIVTNFLSIII